MINREYTQQEREVLRTTLPVPQTPVPLNIEYFPNIAINVRGSTEALPSKLQQLEHYYLYPAADAIRGGFANRPETIGLDGSMALGLFQAFGGDFSEPQNMLAIAAGSVVPLSWEGSEIGLALSVHQFQTARFTQRENQLRTDEKKALSYLGFFDWRALMLEYYKQSLLRLKESGQAHPEFLAVPLLKMAEQRRIHEAMSRGARMEELEQLETLLKAEQSQWLIKQGFIYKGQANGDVMFADIREIWGNENLQKLFEPKPISRRIMPLP